MQSPINYYTYYNPSTKTFENSIYRKTTPKGAAKSIFFRILRHCDDDKFETKLIIKNLDTDKKYFYHCFAVKNPKQRRVSSFKVINIKYEVVLMKIPEQLVT